MSAGGTAGPQELKEGSKAKEISSQQLLDRPTLHTHLNLMAFTLKNWGQFYTDHSFYHP